MLVQGPGKKSLGRHLVVSTFAGVRLGRKTPRGFQSSDTVGPDAITKKIPGVEEV